MRAPNVTGQTMSLNLQLDIPYQRISSWTFFGPFDLKLFCNNMQECFATKLFIIMRSVQQVLIGDYLRGLSTSQWQFFNVQQTDDLL